MPTDKLVLPEHLVFSGGGIKGLCQAGGVSKIEEIIKGKPLINHMKIKSISGSSIGSIIATLCCLGFSGEEILEETRTLNIDIFKNINFTSFINNYGIEDGNILTNWVINAINKKLIKNIEATLDPTFHDLYEQTKIQLTITATSINKGETKYFNHINTPNMLVSLAIRMSCSIPFIFESVTYENETYIDGCVLDDIPCYDLKPDDNFIVLRTTKREEKYNDNNVINLEKFTSQFISCMYIHICKLNLKIYNINDTNSIFCSSDKVSILDTDINFEIKNKLFNEGKESDFSKLKFFKPKPETKSDDSKKET